MLLTNVKIELKSGLIRTISPFKGGVCIENELGDIVYPQSYIIPGITDSHCHLWGLGMMNTILNFTECKSESDCIQRALASPFYRDEWVFGRGWNQECWHNKQMPDLKELDQAFPYNPCYFIRVDGHAAWINSKAMELAGINADTPNPLGGFIIKDNQGYPTGILIDNAMLLVEKVIPDFSNDQYSSFVLKAQDLCIKSGITSVHDMDVSPKMVEICKSLNSKNELLLNIFAFLGVQSHCFDSDYIRPYISKNYNIVGIKMFADGALGSRGAALMNEYNDAPGERGLLLADKEYIINNSEIALDKGLDIAIHAIGDRANREVLDSFECLRKNHGNFRNRLRIEHAQIVAPDDIRRFKDLNVIASIQPIHLLSDEKMAIQRLGVEVFDNHGYPWQSFIKYGVDLIAGSDFPIESHVPFMGMSAFMNRTPELFDHPKHKNEKLNLYDTLKSYTLSPAQAVNSSSGQLRVGYKADLVITDSNISSKEKIGSTEVLAVYIEGELKYSSLRAI